MNFWIDCGRYNYHTWLSQDLRNYPCDVCGKVVVQAHVQIERDTSDANADYITLAGHLECIAGERKHKEAEEAASNESSK